MADHSSTGGGLFTRRPSFFGGKKKQQQQQQHHQHHQHHQSSSHLSSASHTPSPTPSSSVSASGGGTPLALTRTTSNTLIPPTFFETSSSEPPRPHQQAPDTPPRRHKRHTSRHSISSSVADIGASLRRSRSASLRTNTSATTGTSSSSHKKTPSGTLALSFSPEKPASSTGSYASSNVASTAPSSVSSRPTLSISTFTRNKKSNLENIKPGEGRDKTPLSAVDNPKTPFGMSVPLRYPTTGKENRQAQQQPPQQAFSTAGGLAPAAQIPIGTGASGTHNPVVVHQHIHEMASKRISTLDYLRKAYEGRIYWFNTLLYSKPDLGRFPSSSPRLQARRATQYLLLGYSLPTILELHSSSATDYLRALSALLTEFESYQALHPPDGSHPSSLSRGRIPQMFKRTVGGKGRRSSSVTGSEAIGITTSQSSDSLSAFNPDPSTADSDTLAPGEEYTLLLTPSLPFEPDFFSTWATLCDVLIDCYTKIMNLLATPEAVLAVGNGMPAVVADLFGKADAKVRKVVLAGVVKEFEDVSRAGTKAEVASVGRVVLGGLM